MEMWPNEKDGEVTLKHLAIEVQAGMEYRTANSTQNKINSKLKNENKNLNRR